MTLLDIFPSLRAAMAPRLDPALWPVTTDHDERGRIRVGGVALDDIADQYGTPTYVLDEDDVRHRCRAYRTAFPESEIAYAAKALTTRAVADWVTSEGLSLDVCSEGELAIARSAGVDPSRIILHGNAKTATELRTAVGVGVGRIVVDSHTEIRLLASLARRRQRVLVRATPDIDIHGQPAVTTGVDDQKFGFPINGGHLDAAVRLVLEQPSLELVGLHCHLGSQITDVELFASAVERMIGRMEQIRRDHGVILTNLNLGGGHAVPYLRAIRRSISPAWRESSTTRSTRRAPAIGSRDRTSPSSPDAESSHAPASRCTAWCRSRPVRVEGHSSRSTAV